MKAYVLEAVDRLVYKDISKPKLNEGWVLVKVKAAGICSSDIPRIFTKGTYHFPTTPGHEFAGQVECVGNGVNKEWIGKKVGVFPLIPCKKCEACEKGRYEMCSNYDYIGSRRDGAFAEYVAVPEWNLLELEQDADFASYAMLEPLSVALHAVKSTVIDNTKIVHVYGTGMIGFAIALWAKSYGAKKVCVIGRNEEKRAIAENFEGIEYTCKPTETADIVFEAVGSNACIEQAIGGTKEGGTLVLMGNPDGDIALKQDVYWRILRKQLTLKGTWNSAYECGEVCDWTQARDAIATGTIDVTKLVSHVYGQDELEKGLTLMKNHTEPYCKVLTLWNQEG